MKIFNAILGVFAIIASVYCIWFPGMSFLSAGWIITVLLGIWGACALFNALTKRGKDKEKSDKSALVRGILALLAGIAAGVISLLAIFIPRISLIADMLVIYIFVFWLIISGISSIVSSLTVGKAVGGKKWIWMLIFGIITLLAGIYGIFHIILMAKTIGLLLGGLLMFYGIRLFASIFE
ncbi:MAG: DUF308 domain-containing protein [Clostridia bacterium]|nr:DUF308 domain-containing protein [Clostridia bacterium]